MNSRPYARPEPHASAGGRNAPASTRPNPEGFAPRGRASKTLPPPFETPSSLVARPAAPLLQTVMEAAETLRTSAEALRARLRRAQVVGPDGTITSPLGPGIVGIKVGAHTWRVRFDAK
jgi:hypothetical protein